MIPDIASTPQVVVGIPMAMALGLLFGMGPCLISCLPWLGPVFLSSEGGVRQSWRIILPLSLGRLAGYSGLGFAAGYIGQFVIKQIGTSVIGEILGIAAVMVGVALLLRIYSRPASVACAPAPGGVMKLQDRIPLENNKNITPPRALMPGGLFLMGLGMTFNPCAPLGIILFSAAAVASGYGGLLLGLSFGLGAVIAPALVYGIGFAYFSGRLREQLSDWRPHIEKLGASLLIVVGIVSIIRNVWH